MGLAVVAEDACARGPDGAGIGRGRARASVNEEGRATVAAGDDAVKTLGLGAAANSAHVLEVRILPSLVSSDGGLMFGVLSTATSQPERAPSCGSVSKLTSLLANCLSVSGVSCGWPRSS